MCYRQRLEELEHDSLAPAGKIVGSFAAGTTDEGKVAEVLVYDRPLTPLQLEVVWQGLHEKYQIPRAAAEASPSQTATPEHRALASLCHVLLNSNEFLYVD